MLPSDHQGIFFPSDGASQFNATRLLVRSLLSRIATATMVQIVSCTNAGGVAPAGTVDIMPLPNQIDGNGNAIPHGVIYGCPYMRIQGGVNGIIIDPVAGDIGVAVFASRDLSSVIATKAQANPGSRRQFDWADGIYLGGLLNAAPSQYVQFAPAGITIFSPTAVTVNTEAATINASTMQINAAVTIDGPLTVLGSATFNSSVIVNSTLNVNGVEMDQRHTHPLPGGGDTGPVNL